MVRVKGIYQNMGFGEMGADALQLLPILRCPFLSGNRAIVVMAKARVGCHPPRHVDA